DGGEPDARRIPGRRAPGAIAATPQHRCRSRPTSRVDSSVAPSGKPISRARPPNPIIDAKRTIPCTDVSPASAPRQNRVDGLAGGSEPGCGAEEDSDTADTTGGGCAPTASLSVYQRCGECTAKQPVVPAKAGPTTNISESQKAVVMGPGAPRRFCLARMVARFARHAGAALRPGRHKLTRTQARTSGTFGTG